MGLFERIKKVFARVSVTYPSEDFGSAVEALESIIIQLRNRWGDDGWIDVHVESTAKGMLQLTWNSLNLCIPDHENHDLLATLDRAGANDLASMTRSTGPGLWELNDPSPIQLARAANYFIRDHFSGGVDYEFSASIDAGP